MQLETKYNIGAEVAFYKSVRNHIPMLKTDTIVKISIKVEGNYSCVVYSTALGYEVYEDDCYSDLYDLKKHLISKLQNEIYSLKVNDNFSDTIREK